MTRLWTSGSCPNAGRGPRSRRVSTVIRYCWAIDSALALILFALAFVSYNATLTPSLSYASPDGGEIATIPYRLGLLHPTGYPFYTWVAKVFTFIPSGDVAHRINLLSATGAAGSVAVLYGLLRLLTGDTIAAVFGAVLWAASTTLWSQAVIAEVYAPNIFMLALTLFLAIAWGKRERLSQLEHSTDKTRRLLFLTLCLIYGLSLGTHMSNLAFAPALAVYVLVVNWRILCRPGLVAAGAALFALGVMQFLWLPIRAADVNDPLILRVLPTSSDQFYNFTLNAFSNLRWAFPLDALPDRIDQYVDFARSNLGLGGCLLALVGAAEMARLRTREFLLLLVGYGIELAFFLEYRVFDIDVFFIPAHFVAATCAGFGAWRVLTYTRWLGARTMPRWQLATAGTLATTAILFVPLVGDYRESRHTNDRSADTAINDFYDQVFERLPAGSSLVGLTGVIGSDMFYFRLVENRRPDVEMPLLHDPRKATISASVSEYTTWKPQAGRQFPWAPPPSVFPAGSWFIPVLAGPSSQTGGLPFQRPLTLYEVSAAPPPGLVVTNPQPTTKLDTWLLDVRLVGCDLPQEGVPAGGLAHLRIYWAFTRSGNYTVTTRLGNSRQTETHPMTFGNLPRYLREHPAPAGQAWASMEEYDLIVPSSQPSGGQTLTVTVTRHDPGGVQVQASVDVGTITVLR